METEWRLLSLPDYVVADPAQAAQVTREGEGKYRYEHWLGKLLDTFVGLNVVVIGEAMLDCYLVGVADRLCSEAPVPIVTVTDSKQAPGARGVRLLAVQSRCEGDVSVGYW